MKINWFHPIKSIKDRFFYYLDSITENVILTDKNITEMKSRIRSIRGEKINLVFVCDGPVEWSYLNSFYEACRADSSFYVTIVAIPGRKCFSPKGCCFETYESTGAETFFQKFSCRVINGYDYERREWYDLKKLNPDYLFFQHPYNSNRPRQYYSDVVSKYSQLCYIHYGLSMLKGSMIAGSARPFLQYTSFIFAETPYHLAEYRNAIAGISKTYDLNRIFLTGSPRFDGRQNLSQLESPVWKHKKADKIFRVIWTPRWREEENNCNFRKYRVFLFDFAEKNHLDLVFRPHPLAFRNYVAKGILTEQEIQAMIHKYQFSDYCNIDFSENSNVVQYSSDVLVTDPSGFVFEYLLTGKPVIYCEKSNAWANEFSKRVFLNATYRVKTSEDLGKTLLMLREGEDPLKERRREILQSEFYFPSEGAGVRIKNIIKQHFESLHL